MDIKGGSDGEHGVWTPSGKFKFIKFTWQNYITKNLPRAPLEYLNIPRTPNHQFSPKKNWWVRAWYPMQMSHVTNCFYTKIAVFPFKILSLINLEYNHMYLQIRKLSVNALLAVYNRGELTLIFPGNPIEVLFTCISAMSI